MRIGRTLRLLRNVVEFRFSLLHQVCYILRRIEGIAQNPAGIGYQAAGLIFLVDNLCLILDVGRSDDVLRQLSNIDQASGFLQFALRLQILGHGHHIHRPLVELQRLDGAEDDLMAMVVETLRREQARHFFVGFLLHQHRSQHGGLEV